MEFYEENARDHAWGTFPAQTLRLQEHKPDGHSCYGHQEVCRPFWNVTFSPNTSPHKHKLESLFFIYSLRRQHSPTGHLMRLLDYSPPLRLKVLTMVYIKGFFFFFYTGCSRKKKHQTIIILSFRECERTKTHQDPSRQEMLMICYCLSLCTGEIRMWNKLFLLLTSWL